MSVKQNPRITIITSTYNCSSDLQKTADSIRSQSYKNIQWIVIDGKSEDNTVATILQNEDIVSKWMSEPDKGIYDAWNKACRFIDGDWVLFFGAGDIFHAEESLEIFWDHAPGNYHQYGIIYGNVYISKADGSLRYLSRKPELSYWEHGRIALPNHQGVFHKKELFHLDQSFDATLRIAGDTKFMMKALQVSNAYHVDIVLSRMQDDGISNNIKSIRVARKEIKRICTELNIEVPFWSRVYANFRDFAYLVGYSVIPSSIVKVLKKRFDLLRRRKV